MANERANTVFKSGSRWYVHPESGEKQPGVTSIIGMLNKPFLVNWAAKQAAEFVVTNIGSVMPLALSDPKAAVELISGASRRYTKGRGEIGTAAHEIFETLARGQKLPRQHPEMQPYVTHFQEFLDKHQPEFLAMEETVWNGTVGYAGSFDAVMRIDGENVIADWKTSASVYPEVGLQLSAYRHAESFLSGGELPHIDGGAVLHVTADQWKLHPVRCDESVFNIFKALREAFRWDSEMKNHIVGKAL